jgi:hypothetical protein
VVHRPLNIKGGTVSSFVFFISDKMNENTNHLSEHYEHDGEKEKEKWTRAWRTHGGEQ